MSLCETKITKERSEYNKTKQLKPKAMLFPISINDVFESIFDSFSGVYSTKNSEISEIKEEIFGDDKIPSASKDKSNFRSDINNVVKDTNRAYSDLLNSSGNGKAK